MATLLTVLAVVVLVDVLVTLRLLLWARGVIASIETKRQASHLPELTVGNAAPDFSARDLAGRVFRLSDIQGRESILMFATSQCGSCRVAVNSAISVISQEKGEGAELVLFVPEARERVAGWIQEIRSQQATDVEFRVVPDPGYEVTTTYNPRGFMPYYCLINRQSVVVARGTFGDDDWLRLVSTAQES